MKGSKEKVKKKKLLIKNLLLLTFSDLDFKIQVLEMKTKNGKSYEKTFFTFLEKTYIDLKLILREKLLNKDLTRN